jgi:hypothetical protein
VDTETRQILEGLERSALHHEDGTARAYARTSADSLLYRVAKRILHDDAMVAQVRPAVLAAQKKLDGIGGDDVIAANPRSIEADPRRWSAAA